MSELQVSYDDQLVLWNGLWIRPSLLETLRTAAAKLPADEADDVHGALSDALHGQDVLELTQIPARLRRALGL